MKCIVGLGNPGKEYEKTRHNTGFLVIDLLCNHFNVTLNKKKFQSHYAEVNILGQKFLLVKPQTYMNNSGIAVQQLLQYYQIDAQDCLVITDDLDLSVGKVRFKPNGRDGGQRGIRNIIQQLKTQDFPRCKIGIDNNKLIPTANYVLGKVEPEKLVQYNASLEHAKKGIIVWLNDGINQVMNQYNGDYSV